MRVNKSGFLLSIISLSLMLCSCQKGVSPTTDIKADKPVVSTEKGTWDSTPVVLEASAPGTATYSCDVSVIDYSNASEGYIVVSYSGSNPKVKLQITGPDNVTYTYNLHGGEEVFPLTASSGSYDVGVYENTSGTQYSPVLSEKLDVDITNEFGPYLYPSQYIDFDSNSLPVAKSKDISYYCSSDVEVVQGVYNYIIENFTYDYDKAQNVQSGYLPVVDEVFKTNTGICFDYAAVMATMLRSQSIPTRLEVGYIDEAYHAWISTYIKDVGWVNGIIEFDGKDWKLMDPTFASTSSSPMDFISEDSKYLTKYVY